MCAIGRFGLSVRDGSFTDFCLGTSYIEIDFAFVSIVLASSNACFLTLVYAIQSFDASRMYGITARYTADELSTLRFVVVSGRNFAFSEAKRTKPNIPSYCGCHFGHPSVPQPDTGVLSDARTILPLQMTNQPERDSLISLSSGSMASGGDAVMPAIISTLTYSVRIFRLCLVLIASLRANLIGAIFLLDRHSITHPSIAIPFTRMTKPL